MLRSFSDPFIFVFSLSLLLAAGCDTLNLNPRNELGEDDVFKDASLAKSYLNDAYSGIGSGFSGVTMASGVDEAKHTHGWGDGPVRKCNMSATDRGWWDMREWFWEGQQVFEKFAWSEVYGQIRTINIFLRRIEESTAVSSSLKETLMGEAYFLRAFFYHNLMRQHGGVPLIARPFELSGDLEQYQVPRATFKETIDFIVADLDSAATRLSMEPRRKGDAARGAALALKSRVLLYAASDLYSASKSSFDMPEVKYTSGSQQERWEEAKEAAKVVMDLGKYQLPNADSPKEYHDNLLEEDNPEFIWARYFSPDGGEAHDWAVWEAPNGWNSWSGDVPTQQHVNAYENADGTRFKWEGANPESASSPVDAENPYENRDPRFYANIMYNGVEYRPRPAGLQGQDPIGIYQPGWYEMPNQDNLRPGLDTRQGPVQSWNGTWTGYNLIKFLDTEIDPNKEQAYNPWPFIRYAEILLNYAEASANLGDRQDAVEALNTVRNRVGMPDVPPDGGPSRTLMERIQQEREVELAFEEHRYFDVRRWMIAPEVYSEGAKRVRIEGELVDEDHPDAENLVNNYYNYKYNVKQVDQRGWDTSCYFVPIAQDEMNRNPELVQNPEY